jgi:hypothetical protein
LAGVLTARMLDRWRWPMRRSYGRDLAPARRLPLVGAVPARPDQRSLAGGY